MSKFEIYHNYLNYLLLLRSPNEHKYISDVMILSGWKHFSIRSSHTMSRVDQFIIATNGNIQMKNISCLSHFPIKWCLCLRTFFENYLPGKPDLITGESCTRPEGSGQQQWWTIEPRISIFQDQRRRFASFLANKVLTWNVIRAVVAGGGGKL